MVAKPSGTAGISLIIFDCDGVLVDSEPISCGILQQMLQELGIDLSLDAVYERFMGRSMRHCLESIVQLRGEAAPAGFANDYYSRTATAFRAALQAVPGIAATLDSLAIPYCVASSGSHTKMRTTLSIVGLLPRFEGRLFSATDVAQGKPAPDIFLHAARMLGVPAPSCVVVEDSPAGVMAGVAAGMTVFGYAARTTSALLRAAGAHHIFDDMSALPALLRSMPTRIGPAD